MEELTSAYLYGITAVLHPCSLVMSFSALQLLLRLSLEQQQSKKLPFFFILGYAVSVMTIGALVMGGIAQSTSLSNLLKDFSSLFLGPLLILIGMFYTGLIDFKFNQSINKVSTTSFNSRPESALLLGGLLGISFCPATALLFFGAFVPYTLDTTLKTWLILPYTLGVITFLLIAALLLHRGSSLIARHQSLSLKVGKISGGVLILTGLYLSLRYLYFTE